MSRAKTKQMFQHTMLSVIRVCVQRDFHILWSFRSQCELNHVWFNVWAM